MNIFHPEYLEKKSKWQTAIDAYNGEAYSDKIESYLIQKSQREPDGAFEERQKVTEPMLHFSTAIDSLCGVMFSKDGDTSRDWGALGEDGIAEQGTIAKRLENDADGEGTNWNALYKNVAIRLTTTHTIWGMVDGLTEKQYNEGNETVLEGDATVHVLDPTCVVNWYPTRGSLEEVVVKEDYDNRDNIEDFFPLEDVYVKYTLEGWERYALYTDENDETQRRTISTGEYEYYRTAERRERILPIWRTEIPLPRNVGYLLATKQNSIWNLESVRDFAIRALSFALLRITVEGEDDKNKIASALKAGSNILWQYAKEGHPHEFISADSSWLSEAGNVLKKKIEDFYQSAFKEYGDAARQATATEIRLESQSGIEAFLALLVDSVDEFENQALWRIEQVYFPDAPANWGLASVERSRDFQPEDTDEAMNRMLNRTFGERDTIPLPASSIVEIIKKWANSNGITLPEDSELEEAVNQRMDIIPADQMGG